MRTEVVGPEGFEIPHRGRREGLIGISSQRQFVPIHQVHTLPQQSHARDQCRRRIGDGHQIARRGTGRHRHRDRGQKRLGGPFQIAQIRFRKDLAKTHRLRSPVTRRHRHTVPPDRGPQNLITHEVKRHPGGERIAHGHLFQIDRHHVNTGERPIHRPWETTVGHAVHRNRRRRGRCLGHSSKLRCRGDWTRGDVWTSNEHRRRTGVTAPGGGHIDRRHLVTREHRRGCSRCTTTARRGQNHHGGCAVVCPTPTHRDRSHLPTHRNGGKGARPPGIEEILRPPINLKLGVCRNNEEQRTKSEKEEKTFHGSKRK